MEDWPFEVKKQKNFRIWDWVLGALTAILFLAWILAQASQMKF